MPTLGRGDVSWLNPASPATAHPSTRKPSGGREEGQGRQGGEAGEGEEREKGGRSRKSKDNNKEVQQQAE